jgi:alpha-1,2-mannosyltransferase
MNTTARVAGDLYSRPVIKGKNHGGTERSVEPRHSPSCVGDRLGRFSIGSGRPRHGKYATNCVKAVSAVLAEPFRGRERTRTQIAVTVVSTVGAMAAFLATVVGFKRFDLGVYSGAVHHWLINGGDLYAFRYQGSVFGFTYPPFAALVLSPLAVMSWPVAVIAASTASVGAVVLLIRWFVVPVLRLRSWPVWAGCALMFCALLFCEPVRVTFKLGQINLLLLALVCCDHRLLRRGRWAGIGIGIAAAIKLIPAVFIGYLIVTRQYRAALTATCTAAAVTLLAWVIAPQASHAFWTDALWDTDRVGQLAALSNQSIRGVVARLGISSIWWLIAVILILAIWLVRVRRAAAVGDYTTGFALTGILGCLISPVTWVHHLVWLLPALFVMFAAALAETDPRRRRIRTVAVISVYLILSTRLAWLSWAGVQGWAGVLGDNAYVWICLGLLTMTPIRSSPDNRLRGPAGRRGRPRTAHPSPVVMSAGGGSTRSWSSAGR